MTRHRTIKSTADAVNSDSDSSAVAVPAPRRPPPTRSAAARDSDAGSEADVSRALLDLDDDSEDELDGLSPRKPARSFAPEPPSSPPTRPRVAVKSSQRAQTSCSPPPGSASSASEQEDTDGEIFQDLSTSSSARNEEADADSIFEEEDSRNSRDGYSDVDSDSADEIDGDASFDPDREGASSSALDTSFNPSSDGLASDDDDDESDDRASDDGTDDDRLAEAQELARSAVSARKVELALALEQRWSVTEARTIVRVAEVVRAIVNTIGQFQETAIRRSDLVLACLAENKSLFLSSKTSARHLLDAEDADLDQLLTVYGRIANFEAADIEKAASQAKAADGAIHLKTIAKKLKER